jgi:hypothetical protein
MKKILMLALVITGVSGIARSDEGQRRQLRVNVSFDYFDVGDFKDAFEDDTDEKVSQVNSLGFSATGHTKTDPGVGGRAGATYDFKNNFYLGGSVGYIDNLRAQQTATLASGAEAAEENTKVHFYRYLVEAGRRFPMSDQWGFKVGVGAGLAQGHADIDSNISGVVNGSKSASKSWSGFAWEVSPALYFNASSSTELSVGVRYAQFPSLDASDDNVKIRWDTFGLFAGITF